MPFYKKQKNRNSNDLRFLYSERDLNPHEHCCSLDFKSSVSTNFTIRAIGAKNGARTRDLDLGKVALYQLSYFRIEVANLIQKINNAKDLLKKTRELVNNLIFNQLPPKTSKNS
jgi:hypothetical protein